MYIYIYVCMYACMHACMYVCVYVCMRVCVYVCMCVCDCMWLYVCMCVCVYVCMHACMCVCMYVCMDACMHVCVWMDGWMHACNMYVNISFDCSICVMYQYFIHFGKFAWFSNLNVIWFMSVILKRRTACSRLTLDSLHHSGLLHFCIYNKTNTHTHLFSYLGKIHQSLPSLDEAATLQPPSTNLY